MRTSANAVLLIVAAVLAVACASESPSGPGDPAPVATVTVSPASPVIAIGTTTDLTAETRVAGGQVVTGRVITWSSSNTSVATVDASGTVTAVSTGTATITATSEGQSGDADLTVFLPFREFGLGQGSSCALDDSGAAYCWGGNGWGELGVGDLDSRSAPTAVGGSHTFTYLGKGFNFSCGLDGAGAAWCWGMNTQGQVGSGGTADFQVIPAAVSGGHTFSLIAVGGDHACGVTDPAGDVWCWGYNVFGQLGDGGTTDSNVPVQVTGGLTFSSIGLGSYHSCGVTTSDAAYCWGRGGSGQIGDGTTNDAASGPVAVSGGLTLATIDGGQNHTCAWTSAGTAQCWGNNDFGQLGDGTTTSSSTPVTVTGGLAFAEAGTNGYLSCGTVAPGETYCWGWNARGEIGDGTTTDRATPTQPSGNHGLVSVAAGFQTACGLTAEGLAFCWGANGNGELGDGTLTDRLTPTMVQPPE